MDTPTPADNGAATTEIARISPEAAGLMVQYMDASRRETDSLVESLRELERQDLERWKQRALDAEARLLRIEDRLLGLIYDE